MASFKPTRSLRHPRFANLRAGAAWRLCLLSATAIGAAAPAMALDYSAIFTTKGQSVYDSGPAFTIDTGTRRFGPGPQNLGKSYGKVFDPCDDTPLPSCATGAEAGADLHFNIGLNYGLKVNSGSFDAQYPINVNIGTPADGSNAIGDPFKLTSSYTTPGYTAPKIQLDYNGARIGAVLQAHSPTLQSFVDLDASFNTFVGARACVVGICQGPALGRFDVDASRNLVALNRNNDGLIRVGDTTVMLNQYFTTLNGNLTARLNIPNIDAISSQPGGSTANNLVTLGRGNIAAVGVNIAGLLGNVLPVPLSGNIGGIGYNLLSASGGVSLDLRQTLNFAVTPFQTYDFLRPVRQQFADGTISGFTKQITVPLGAEITLLSGQRNVGVVPSTSLVVTLSNLTELVIGGDASIQALAANIFGFDIGPLYDSGSVNGGLFSIPLFSNSFSVPFQRIFGTPFNILQNQIFLNAEQGSRALFGLANEDPLAPGVYKTEISSLDLDCPNCLVTYLADGSPVAFDSFGSFVFLNMIDALDLPGIQPGVVGTDADQIAALAATGFTTVRPPFVSPPGTPRPPGSIVPEPMTWAMMIAGFGLVGGALRHRRRQQQSCRVRS